MSSLQWIIMEYNMKWAVLVIHMYVTFGSYAVITTTGTTKLDALHPSLLGVTKAHSGNFYRSYIRSLTLAVALSSCRKLLKTIWKPYHTTLTEGLCTLFVLEQPWEKYIHVDDVWYESVWSLEVKNCEFFSFIFFQGILLEIPTPQILYLLQMLVDR